MNMGTIGCDSTAADKDPFDTFEERKTFSGGRTPRPSSMKYRAGINDPLWRSIVEQYTRERNT
jgi:hypothetical protein